MVSAVFLIDIYLYSRSLSARAFVADFPPAAPEFHQRTHRVRLRNLGTTDKKIISQNQAQKDSESTCMGKGGTTHGADRQADTDLRPQSG